MAKEKKAPKSTLERAIESRERGIERMKNNMARIRKNADEQIARIAKEIELKKVVLDALKRGAIKP